MGIQVITDPKKTTFRFPNEPGLDELYAAETNRRYANARFWGGFTLLFYVLVILFIGWLADWSPIENVRSILFALGGAMIVRLLDKMKSHRTYTKRHLEWVKTVENDPDWQP